MITIFVISGVLYFLSSSKIDDWTTMLLLSRPTLCPAPFLSHGWVYRLISFLFVAVFAASGFASTLNVWAVALIVPAVWLLAGVIGRKAAFERYRKQGADAKALFSGPHYANDPEAPELIAAAEAQMRKTNEELQEEANRAARLR